MSENKIHEGLEGLSDEIENHEEEFYRNFSQFRNELNNNKKQLRRLGIQDFHFEKNINRKIRSLFIGKGNKYKFPPKIFDVCLTNHVVRLESRSNYWSLCASLFAIITAIMAVDDKAKGLWTIGLGVVCFGFFIAKWNLELKITRTKQLINHIKSLPERPLSETCN